MRFSLYTIGMATVLVGISGCGNSDTDMTDAKQLEIAKQKSVAAGVPPPYSPSDMTVRAPETANQASTKTTEPSHRFANWSGRWVGVEGLFAQITPTISGQYNLKIQSDLDTLRDYKGYDSEHGIKFEKDGKTQSLTRVTGNEIGLKYLAGKKECLMIKSGEGFCRD